MKQVLRYGFLFLSLLSGLRAARPETNLNWRNLEDHHLQRELNKIYGGPRWLDEMDQARKVARLQRNHLLVLFSKRGDDHSSSLKRNTLGAESVWKALGSYTLVELDVDRNFDLAFQYQLRSVPTLIWMTPDGQELYRVVGEISAEDLNAFIERIQHPDRVPLPPAQAGRVKAFAESGGDADIMARILEDFSGDGAGPLREALRELDPAPLQTWVKLLAHPTLSVRLAALELLEERAGKSFDFDPWAETGTQTAALTAWENWRENLGDAVQPRFAPLTRSQLEDSIRDLDSDSEPHVLRAVQRLESAGGELLPHIEEIRKQTVLSERQQSRLEDILMTLRISALGWPDAAGAAFRLRRGPVNTRMQLIRKLGNHGEPALPVLEMFVDDPEVLIREAVMESLLQAGGVKALPRVLARMADEPSADIALAVMRRLAKMPDPDASKWLETQLNATREERILGALEAMQAGKHDSLAPRVIELLGDARWRVRAAAATTLGAIRYKAGLAALLEHRADPDDFARTAILDACLKMMDNREQRTRVIGQWFEENALDATAVLTLACENRIPLPDNLLAATVELPKPRLLNLLQIFLDCGGTAIPVALQLAENRDEDIRVSALRILAQQGLRASDAGQTAKAEKLLAKALREEKDGVVEILLMQLRFPRNNMPQMQFSNIFGGEAPEEVADLLSAFGGESSGSPSPPPKENREDLEDLLSAFADPDEAGDSPGGAEPGLTATLERLFRESENREVVDAASVALISKGNPDALKHLLTILPRTDGEVLLSVMSMNNQNNAGLELALALQSDPREDLRRGAISLLASQATVSHFLPMLDRLGRPGEKLNLRDLPLDSWGFRYALAKVKSYEAAPYIDRWLNEKPGAEGEDGDGVRKRVAVKLAMVTRYRAASATLRKLAKEHADPDLRALSWIAVAALERALAEADRKHILADSSHRVRNVLPFLYIRSDNKSWRISGKNTVDTDLDNAIAGGSWNLFMQEAEERDLAALLEEDDPEISLLAGLALYSQWKEIPDQTRWRESLQKSPSPSWSRELAGEVLYAQYQSGRDPEGVLMEWLLQHFGESYRAEQLRNKAGPAAAPAEEENTLLAMGEPGAPAEAPVVVYIYSENCGDCDTVNLFLEKQLEQFPELKIQAVNIDSPGAAALYNALFRRFDLPLTGVGLTPMLAGSGDIASGSVDLTFERVGQIIASSMDGSGMSWIPAISPEEEASPSPASAPVAESADPSPAEKEVEAPSRPAAVLHLRQAVLLILLPMIGILLLLPPPGRLPALLTGLGAGIALSLLPLPNPDLLLITVILVLLPLLVLRRAVGPSAETQTLSAGIKAEKHGLQELMWTITAAVLLLACGWALPWGRIPQLLPLLSAREWIPVCVLLPVAMISTFRRWPKVSAATSAAASLLLLFSLF